MAAEYAHKFEKELKVELEYGSESKSNYFQNKTYTYIYEKVIKDV